jgi:hypothetical protein
VAGQLRAGKAVDVAELVNTAGVVAAETVVKRDGRIFLSADSGTMTLTGQASATSADQDAAGTISLHGQGNTTVGSAATVAAGRDRVGRQRDVPGHRNGSHDEPGEHHDRRLRPR